MKRSITERILAKAIREGECLVWTGYTMKNGYGTISWGGQRWLIHRAIWTEAVGAIPDGLTIDHVKARGCSSKACVNVEHMEVVTRGENSRRGGGLEAAWGHYRSQTHCKDGHEFTPENTYIRKGDRARICRVCARAGWRAYKARRGVIPDRRVKRAPCPNRHAWNRHRRNGETCAECAAVFGAPVPKPPRVRQPLKPCGTQAAYERHRKAGEICQPCRAAKAAHERARRATRSLTSIGTYHDVKEAA